MAAKEATRTTPVVFAMGGDPVETGLVASLNRPGGNLTGIAVLGAEIAAKRLDLLHKLVPTASSIAMLTGRGSPFTEAEMRGAQTAARALGVRLLVFAVVTDDELAAAFTSLTDQKAGALLISGGVRLDARSDQIIALAARHAIPAMFYSSSSVRLGGLASYGPDLPAAYRLAGIYAGRILKGEKPADLPVQQSTKFELVFNLKTAKVLVFEIPPTLLAVADSVVE